MTITTESANGANNFSDLGIDPRILEILSKQGFTVPTPIQHKVIPCGLQGKDIIGIAQTGTGKTLGFGIPVLQYVANGNGRGLIVVPTRELAIQVAEVMKNIGTPLAIRHVILIGGSPMYRQMRELRNNPQVIIATPGRLLDHMRQKTVKLDNIGIVVLDEADHMFDIGFAPQVREIMKAVPEQRQTLLFSATMPEEILRLATQNMKLPLRIEVAPAGTTAEKVEQEIIVVNKPSKFSLLVKTISECQGPVLVFARTKHGTKDIARGLRETGITASEIHSNRSLGQRREALDGFKNHKYRVLVATDIAARGIDVKDIELVVNYDLPEQTDDYVHRIGRTGRAEKTGKAISFATPDQKHDVASIERLIKKTIPRKSHDGAQISEFSIPPSRRNFRGGFRGRPSFRRRSFGTRQKSRFGRNRR